jgi:hypothetical protein
VAAQHDNRPKLLTKHVCDMGQMLRSCFGRVDLQIYIAEG